MKEAIIYLLFDNWCNSEHEPEVKEAMDKAIQNPTEDTIFVMKHINVVGLCSKNICLNSSKSDVPVKK